jgi:hypothetical protein
MSCYEWERGEFKLPTAEYSKFRKNLIVVWNNWWDQIYTVAKDLYPKVKKMDWEQLYKACDQMAHQMRWGEEGAHNLISILWDSKSKKIVSPKKKDLPKKPVSKGCSLPLDEACITFVDASRVVIWEVDENNHSCDRAHEHYIARKFFEALNRVQWTRGTGGKIIGNDEYNRESDWEGGGGNYVKQEFGPNSKPKPKKSRFNFFTPYPYSRF